MKAFNWIETVKLAVKQKNMPAVYVTNGLEYETSEDTDIWNFVMESMKEMFGEKTNEYYEVMTNMVYGGLFFFDTFEQAEQFYRIFDQPLTDSSKIYACLFDNTGKCLNENT